MEKGEEETEKEEGKGEEVRVKEEEEAGVGVPELCTSYLFLCNFRWKRL